MTDKATIDHIITILSLLITTLGGASGAILTYRSHNKDNSQTNVDQLQEQIALNHRNYLEMSEKVNQLMHEQEQAQEERFQERQQWNNTKNDLYLLQKKHAQLETQLDQLGTELTRVKKERADYQQKYEDANEEKQKMQAENKKMRQDLRSLQKEVKELKEQLYPDTG